MNLKGTIKIYGFNVSNILFFLTALSLPGAVLPFLYDTLSPTLISVSLFSALIGLFVLAAHVKQNFSKAATLIPFYILLSVQGFAIFKNVSYIATRSYRRENIKKIEAQSKLPSAISKQVRSFNSGTHNTNGLYSSLKASIKQIMYTVFPRKFPYTESFFEFNISFNDYGSTEVLLEEIFANNIYYFSTSVKNPVIIDGGSNIGISILYFKKLYPKAKIFAFEPDQDAFTCLEKNVNNNNLQNVQLHKKALSSIVGQITLYSGSRGSAQNSIFKEWSHNLKNKQVVSCVKLSDYINGRIDLLKLDIEGAEDQVIEELAQQNKIRYIQRIIMEYHHHIEPNTDCLSKLLKILEENNFGYHIGFAGSLPFSTKETKQAFMISAYKKTSEEQPV